MNDKSAAIFLPTAYTGEVWKLARHNLAYSRNHAAPGEGTAEAEMAVRDLHARVTYAVDLGDVDQVMPFFTMDCTLTNARGTFSGSRAIRADYEQLFRDVPRRFHVWSSLVVRMSEDFRSGRLTSYFYAVLQPLDQSARVIGGIAADEVVQIDGEWKFRSRTTSMTFMHPLAAPNGH